MRRTRSDLRRRALDAKVAARLPLAVEAAELGPRRRGRTSPQQTRISPPLVRRDVVGNAAPSGRTICSD